MALNDYHWATNRHTMQTAQPFAFRRSEVNRPLEFGFEQSNFNGYQNYLYSRAYNFDRWDHFNSSHQNLQCAPQPANQQFPEYSPFEPHQNPQKPAWESSIENYIKSQAEWTEKMEESFKKLNYNIDLLIMQSNMLQTRIAQQADASSCINQGEDKSVQIMGASNQNATALNQGDSNYSSQCAPAPNQIDDSKLNEFDCIEEMVDDDFEDDSLDDLLRLILENSELLCCSSEVIEIAPDLNSCLFLHPDSGAPAPPECDLGAPALLACDSLTLSPLAFDSSAPESLACDSDAPAPLACDSAMGAVQIKNANIIDSLGDTSNKIGCISNSSHNEKNSGLKEKSSDATYDVGDNTSCRDKIWCETKHELPITEEDGSNHDYLLEFLSLDPGEKRVLISLAASSPTCCNAMVKLMT